MADKSAIEWTNATWNPVTGCTKISPGCDHRARRWLLMAGRTRLHGVAPYVAHPPGPAQAEGPGPIQSAHDIESS